MHSPTLIAFGGFPGCGKSAVSKRLSRELNIPRFGSDSIGIAIRESKGYDGDEAKAGWIAYDLLFELSEDQISSGISVILDINLGWKFQWKKLDAMVEKYEEIRFLPILLEASRSTCLKRIKKRYASDSSSFDPPGLYENNETIETVREFIEKLDRRDIHLVDASKSFEAVYKSVLELVKREIKGPPVKEVVERLKRRFEENEIRR